MNPYYGSAASMRDLGELEFSDKLEVLLRQFDPTADKV
jgi:hypothetical protein